MSTVSTIHPPNHHDATLPEDPYCYGWRYVRVRQADGTETVDQRPLTLEDVLHPETGDFIVESVAHDNDRSFLKYVFKFRLADDPHAAVVSDCRIDWNLSGIRPLGPDVAVFLEVMRQLDWTTLNVAAERVQPALVVEVTSPRTRVNDVETKFNYYHRARVPLYVIVDAVDEAREPRRLELHVYRYQPQGYEPIAPDPRGLICLETVDVWLGVVRDSVLGGDRVACFDAVTGDEIGDYTVVTRAAEQAMTRAKAEAESRAHAETHARAEAARAESEARAGRCGNEGRHPDCSCRR
jgi:Uma2 family endonuclease